MTPLSAEPVKPELRRDFAALRDDFPALQQRVHGKPLAYLDSAASSQAPNAVHEATALQHRLNHANVHRGVHTLSERATNAFEGAREKVRRYINAASTEEIIFTRGTTEAINLVAASLGRTRLRKDDEVLITWMEHHSNIVPWQMLCEQTGARLVVAPIDDSGTLDVAGFEARLNERTKIVAITHVSNALGTVNPVAALTTAAHRVGSIVLIDGAQAMPHLRVDVRALDCDFYAFSGHKMFGPTGVGVLYGKRALLAAMPPYQGGGDMILTVSFERTVYNELPYKFEAGTPHVAGAAGLGAAIEYLEAIGMDRISSYEDSLLRYATKAVEDLPGVRIVGTASHKAGVLSFTVDGIHPHDLGTVLDHQGVAIRTGHHCAMPVMEFFGIAGTARASFAFYNTERDIDQLVEGLRVAIRMLR